MQPIRVFISSVQSEFAWERKGLCDYLRRDALLGKFFAPFIFEELPAINKSVTQAYLQEASNCDIYLGIYGSSYGYEDGDGVSPTEREYDAATAKFRYRMIFLKEVSPDLQHPKEAKFISRVEQSVVRKKFNSYEELQSAVYAALIRYLEEKEVIRMLPFDAAYHLTATLEDIDEKKVQLFVEQAKAKRGFPLSMSVGVKAVLSHLNLISNDERLTNAAILLFAKNPQTFFITSEVKCAQFYGDEITKPIPAYQVYRGSVFELIEQAVSFVMSRINLRIGTRKKRTDVDVEYELPIEAVREAIVNAVTHRDYTSNGSVQIMLFRNRLEIWNPGSLPYGLTIPELYGHHPSIPPNPVLANPVYLAGYIERMGTGTHDIINKCKKMGLKSPTFEQAENFKVTLWRSTEDDQMIAEEPTKPTTGQVAGQPQDKLQDNLRTTSGQVAGQPQQLLLAMGNKEMSVREMMETMSLSGRANFLNTYLNKALELGFVVPKYPDTPNHPRQKYKITEAGKALIKNLKKIL